MAPSKIDLESEWATIQRGIDRVVSFIDSNGVNPNQNQPLFTPDEHILLYTVVYTLCCLQRDSHIEFELYNRYKYTFQAYINTRVLPSLRGKNGEYLLREYVKRWYEHLYMVRFMTRSFSYLDNFFVPRHSLPSMKETAISVFFDQVYQEMKGEIIGAVLSMINEDRDGTPIDGELVKGVIKIFTEMKLNKLDLYQNDFEPAYLDSSVSYYDKKLLAWICELSHSNYMLKVDECLKIESFKGSQYLHPNTVRKLPERIRYESEQNKLNNMVGQLELGNNKY